jgi:chromosome segregation ATPase
MSNIELDLAIRFAKEYAQTDNGFQAWSIANLARHFLDLREKAKDSEARIEKYKADVATAQAGANKRAVELQALAATVGVLKADYESLAREHTSVVNMLVETRLQRDGYLDDLADLRARHRDHSC